MASGSYSPNGSFSQPGNEYCQKPEDLGATNARDINLSMPSPLSPEARASPGDADHDPLMDSLCNELLNVTFDQSEDKLTVGEINGGKVCFSPSQIAPPDTAGATDSGIPHDIAADVNALAALLAAGSAPVPVNSLHQNASARLLLPGVADSGLRQGGFGSHNFDNNGGTYAQSVDPWSPGTGGDHDGYHAYGSFPSTASTSESSTSAALGQRQQQQWQWQQQQISAWHSNLPRDRALSSNPQTHSHNGNRTPVVCGYAARDNIEHFGRQVTSRTHAPSGPSPTAMHHQAACFSPHHHAATGSGGNLHELLIVHKFGTEGSRPAEFKTPNGFCLGINGEIIVADTKNNRIQVFDSEGRFRHAFGLGGRDDGRLWNPRHVAYLRRHNRIVVFDEGVEGSRMQLFTKAGEFQKKINISFVEIVAGVTTTKQNELVIVDSVKPTCFVISEMGDLRKWFDCAPHMTEPSDIAVWNQNFFICDFKEHCVCIFDSNGKFMRKIGQKGMTDYPNGIDITPQGQILVADSHSNRMHICMLSQEGHRLMDFECSPKELPKVQRCCGLKLTSNGQVVSVIRNTNMVLVMALPFETNSGHHQQYQQHVRYASGNQLLLPHPSSITTMRPPPHTPFVMPPPPPSAPADLMTSERQHFFPSNSNYNNHSDYHNNKNNGHHVLYTMSNFMPHNNAAATANTSPVMMENVHSAGCAYHTSNTWGNDCTNGAYMNTNDFNNNNNNNNGGMGGEQQLRQKFMWQQMLAQQPQTFFPPNDTSSSTCTGNNNDTFC